MNKSPVTSAYDQMPKAVRVGCYIFRIEVMEFEDAEHTHQFGHTNTSSQKIRLRPNMMPQNLANTFIHEVLHAIYWYHSCCAFLTFVGANASASDVEEEFVTKAANGLCSFWQDNPQAAEWWQKIVVGGDFQ